MHVWLPDGEKIEDTITRFGRIHERDGRTDGRTPYDGKTALALAWHTIQIHIHRAA